MDTKIKRRHILNRIIRKICAVFVCTALLLTGCSKAPSSNDSTEGKNDDNKYKQFSPILQKVLTENYYLWMIQEAETDKKDNDFSYMYANIYKAVPFGFLESEGYDKEDLQSSQILCYADPFILEDEKNSLYITCQVKNQSSIEYYTHYIIKYELTDQELKDLNLLYKNINGGYNSCYQASFFVQELSYQKEATKLSETNISEESIQELKRLINNDEFDRVDLSMFSNAVQAIYVNDVVEYDNITHSYTFAFYDIGRLKSTIHTEDISQITVSIPQNQSTNIDGKDVYTGGVSTFIWDEKYKTVTSDSLKKATFYSRGHSNLLNMLDEDYADLYGIK